MKVIGDVQCGQDASHTRLDHRGKRCRECGTALQKKCPGCESLVNYSNAAKHIKKCVGDKGEEEAESKRVGYLASEWDLEKGTLPLGQYCGSCAGFPEHFRKLVVKDPTGESSNIVDAYDAVWGTIFATTRLKLVHTFTSLDAILEANWEGLPDMDIVVIGNWGHPKAFEDNVNGKSLAEEVYHKLQDLEIDRHILVFPPLDYAWYFARKVHYYNKLSLLRLPSSGGIHIIPTIAVPTEHFWKKPLQAFAKENNVRELILKREISEISKHVYKMKVDALEALEGRTTGFRWMAQPVLEEFAHEREFRMFVVDGRCLWGVATRVLEDDAGVSVHKIGCAPGRKAWDSDGGKEAAAVAERVVEVVRKDMVHAGKFLRVDMVKRNGGGWWINELEYFGNAFIHFETFDNAEEFLDQIVQCISSWLAGR
jgi:hypothetical protein